MSTKTLKHSVQQNKSVTKHHQLQLLKISKICKNNELKQAVLKSQQIRNEAKHSEKKCAEFNQDQCMLIKPRKQNLSKTDTLLKGITRGSTRNLLPSILSD